MSEATSPAGASGTPEQVAVEYLGALSTHDLDRAVECWAPGARQNVRGQIDTVAPDGVRDQMSALLAAIPDVQFEIVATTSQDERCAVQWVMRGTFDGATPLYGIRPTGTHLELEGVDVFTVRAGLIHENNAFSDTMAFARQIGMMPPQGSRAESALTALFNLRGRLRRPSHQAIGTNPTN